MVKSKIVLLLKNKEWKLVFILCKFFAYGASLKGEHCEFSHDWKDLPHNVNLLISA